ncbi:hypothetical protein F442_02096 [Phytophthora nicotianae P10297]|uniref:Uncharacterized protein n=1 Tax=Phytophthora nicotianae P10297 TaxID=1317064 RepID=W3A0B3_PHYNI|nr:hypothetical protein F442_02096 [Phytophthora nicotianae P10297]
MVIAIVSAKTPQSPSKPLILDEICDDNLKIKGKRVVNNVDKHVTSVVKNPTPVTNTIDSTPRDPPTGQEELLRRRRRTSRGTIPDEVKATTANPDNKLKGDVLLHDIISDMTLDDIQVLFEIRESLTSLPAAHTALDMSPTLLIVFYVTLLFAQLWDPPLDLDVGFSICFLLAHVM